MEKPRRRTRAEANADTEARVLRSAREHFERFGYHAASVEAIAEDAGFSKGAVYSRYRTRDDLFLAVLRTSIDDRQREVDGLAGPSTPVDLQAFALEQSTRTLRWQATLLEFRIHASRDPVLNDRYRQLHETAVSNVARSLEAAMERSSFVPTRSVRDLAIAALAEATGVVVERLVDPDVEAPALLGAMGELARLAGARQEA